MKTKIMFFLYSKFLLVWLGFAFCLFVCLDRVSLCHSDCLGALYVDQTLFELIEVLLPVPPEHKIKGIHCTTITEATEWGQIFINYTSY